MSRVINLHSPGKIRNQLMRTGAELISRLGQKTEIDEETRDMIAFLIFCLRDIDDGIGESVLAWEKRDYWVKAEQFRIRWSWVRSAASELEEIARSENWEQLPMMMVQLYPYFEDIKVVKYTRTPDLWEGAYGQLLNGNAQQKG